MDLVQVAILPGVSAELKRNAEDQLLARLPQLPLGQKITLARRGPARVPERCCGRARASCPVVLDNPYMTEAQILRRWREKNCHFRDSAIVQHRNGPLLTPFGWLGAQPLSPWPRFFRIFPS